MEPVTARATIVPGIAMQFRGVAEGTEDLLDIELVLPPLNLNSLRRLKDRIGKFGVQGGLDDMETLLDVVQEALNRNYSGIPRWLIEQSIDVANMADMMSAVMDVSGMKRKEIEAGKVKAADSTGTSSSVT